MIFNLIGGLILLGVLLSLLYLMSYFSGIVNIIFMIGVFTLVVMITICIKDIIEMIKQEDKTKND